VSLRINNMLFLAVNMFACQHVSTSQTDGVFTSCELLQEKIQKKHEEKPLCCNVGQIAKRSTLLSAQGI
jgi:hypothetical protein